jgi:hypothetical protein
MRSSVAFQKRVSCVASGGRFIGGADKHKEWSNRGNAARSGWVIPDRGRLIHTSNARLLRTSAPSIRPGKYALGCAHVRSSHSRVKPGRIEVAVPI